MGWNEMPEGKDPWKEPPKEPEFDLWWKKLRARWPRRPRGPDPWRGLRRNHRITLFIPFVVLALFWLGTGFVTVPAGRVGYVFVLGHAEGTLTAGTHWLPPWPFTRVLEAAPPLRGKRFLRLHAFTADGRLVVVRLRYRIREPHPERRALAYAGFERLLRARLRHLVAVLVMQSLRSEHVTPAKSRFLRARLLRLWSRTEPANAPSSPGPARPTTNRVPSWGRLEILSLSFAPPRALRKETLAFRRLARRQATALAAEREHARARLALARIEAGALLERAKRADAEILRRARNRIAVFRALLPVYRHDPVLVRRLLDLDLLRRALGRKPTTVTLGKRTKVVIGPVTPGSGTTAAPVHRRPSGSGRPSTSSSHGPS
jgi:hypothetical protein